MLYWSLWASCNALRGGTDASQYKDYVLILLFIKYVSDKYAGQPFAPITIPEGASFSDMVALKGKPDIGDQINKKIVGQLANANKLSDMPDFNDATKLGTGKEMVDRLTHLIASFEDKRLDNLPRYIDGQTPEDVQDVAGHLQGGIPAADVDGLQRYWDGCPQLRTALFRHNRTGYVDLAIEKAAIKPTIYGHPEFAAFLAEMNDHFDRWRKARMESLKALKAGCHPKEVIAELSEDLLKQFHDKSLIDAYDIYQHLLDYWAETMQDDCYLIAADGWKAETYRVLAKNAKGKEVDKGWACDLVPKPLICRPVLCQRTGRDRPSCRETGSSHCQTGRT